MAARTPMTSAWRWTMRLLIWARSVATAATRSATSRTSASSSAAGNDRLAHPIAAASTPVMSSPVSMISMARRMPSRGSWYCQSGGLATRTIG